MKKITNKVLWIFAIGQFGWSLLSGIISNWLVYYYTDSQAGVFGKNITGGTLFWSITLFGLITMVGRIFDAVTDPMIAGWSDRSNFKGGRRIPFMKVIAVPFAVMTACERIAQRHYHFCYADAFLSVYDDILHAV